MKLCVFFILVFSVNNSIIVVVVLFFVSDVKKAIEIHSSNSLKLKKDIIDDVLSKGKKSMKVCVFFIDIFPVNNSIVVVVFFFLYQM